MIGLSFLADWAIRSSILILIGGLLLWALRAKDASIRLAAWKAVLFGSLAIPIFIAALPKLPLNVMRPAAPAVPRPAAVYNAARAPAGSPSLQVVALPKPGAAAVARFNWARAALTLYIAIALALLLRLCLGLAMSLRLLRDSTPTARVSEGIEIRESGRIAAPVTLGIARPAIVVPIDWREWGAAKLDAVLAHEGSHIRRFDPAVQLLSAIHRALLWFSPLSWFLHKRIVRLAEEASDDAVVAVTRDRAAYAEVLLDFMRRGVRNVNWLGVPMARYGRPDQRIHRILDGTTLSRGITRWSLTAILAIGSPLAYVVAAAHPQSPPKPQTAAPAPVQATTTNVPASNNLAAKPADRNSHELPAAAQSPNASQTERSPGYVAGLGNVVPYYTVTIRSRVDGQLMSVAFKEGDMVQAGQLLASIDPRPYQIQIQQAEGPLIQDQAALDHAHALVDAYRNKVAQQIIPREELDQAIATAAQFEGKVKMDQAKVDEAKLQLSYTQITAPITGLAGLRLVDPGNVVRAADPTGIVIISQLQPIAVLFTIPEDNLPKIFAQPSGDASPVVEAWDRTNSAKLATGHLAAVDNQIDVESGTLKLKAVFDNKDRALFPNQFVNVRMYLK